MTLALLAGSAFADIPFLWLDPPTGRDNPRDPRFPRPTATPAPTSIPSTPTALPTPTVTPTATPCGLSDHFARWGGPAAGQSVWSHGLTTGQGGRVYVTDYQRHAVLVFDAAGSFLFEWGGLGSAGDRFQNPHDIEADASGALYVADDGNSAVKKFDASGAYLSQIDVGGWANGLGLDPAGNIYVGVGFSTVKKYSPSGALLASWGSGGSGAGQFNRPYDVAVGPGGEVYVADRDNQRIQKFDASGAYLAQFNAAGALGYVEHVFCDASGNVFAVSSFGLWKFDAAGVLISQWTVFNASGFCPDGAGGFLASLYGANPPLRRIDASGAQTGQFGAAAGGGSQVNGPYGIAVDAAFNVYVVEANRVRKFDQGGNVLITYPGSFNSARGAAVDGAGKLYVANGFGDNVLMFDAAGSPAGSFGTTGTGPGQFNMAGGVALAPDGSVWVADVNNSRVQHFSAAGAYLGGFGSNGTGPGQFSQAYRVTVDPSGNIYVQDLGARLQKFLPDGTYVSERNSGAFGLATDTAGYVYGASSYYSIYKYSPSGALPLLRTWSCRGNGPGQLEWPWDVAVDSLGRVYVADNRANAIQILLP